MNDPLITRLEEAAEAATDRRAALLDACIKLRDDYGTSDLDEVIAMLTPSAPTTRTSHD